MSLSSWVDARLDRQRKLLVAELGAYVDGKVTELRGELMGELATIPADIQKFAEDLPTQLTDMLHELIPRLPFGIVQAPIPQQYKPETRGPAE